MRAHSEIVGTADAAVRGDDGGQLGGRLMRQYARLRIPMSMLMISCCLFWLVPSSCAKKPVGRCDCRAEMRTGFVPEEFVPTAAARVLSWVDLRVLSPFEGVGDGVRSHPLRGLRCEEDGRLRRKTLFTFEPDSAGEKSVRCHRSVAFNRDDNITQIHS